MKHRVKKWNFLFLAGLLSVGSVVADTVKTSGGSNKVELGYGISLNDGSTLEREWVTVNDKKMPVALVGSVGVGIIYDAGSKYSSGDYLYSTEYKVIAKEDVRALKVNFLLFDVWGDRTKTLASTDIRDIKAGEETSLDAKWRLYSENEASEYLASIAYVDMVRTASGKVYRADKEIILKEARRFSKEIKEEDLKVSPDKK